MRRRLLDKSRSWTRKSSEVSAPVALIVGGEIDGKAALLAAVSKDLVKRGLKAGDAAAKEVVRRWRRPDGLGEGWREGVRESQ